MLVVLLAVCVGVLSVIVFGLLRTHAEILRALDRAGVPLDGSNRATSVSLSPTPMGAVADTDIADIVGTVPSGGPVKIALGGHHHTLLAFLSSGCRTCAAFWEAFADPALILPGGTTRLALAAPAAVREGQGHALKEMAAPIAIFPVRQAVVQSALLDLMLDPLVGLGPLSARARPRGC